MKGKKYGIIVSVITMAIAFAIILLICCSDKNKCEVLLNIIIGVLGSSVVALIVSVSDYIVAKREALEDYYNQVYKIIVAFSKIKYIHISASVIENVKFKAEEERKKIFGAGPSEMYEILNHYEEHRYFDDYPEDLSIDEKKQIISQKVDKDFNKILKAMNSYLQFDDVNYEEVENAYRRISFLTDKPKWCCRKENAYRTWLYKTFHEKLRNALNVIRLENYHFNLYNNQEAANILIIAKKVEELNSKFFDIKVEKAAETASILVYPSFFYDMMDNLEEFRSRIYKCEKGKRMRTPIFTQISKRI